MSSKLIGGGLQTAYKLAGIINKAYADAGMNNYELQQPAVFADGVEDFSIAPADWPPIPADSSAAIIANGATPDGENVIFPAFNGSTTVYVNAEELRSAWGQNWLDGVQSYIGKAVYKPAAPPATGTEIGRAHV